jgi:molybdate transport system substrate-binding protein
LISALEPEFLQSQASLSRLDGEYGPVGQWKDKLMAGYQCDIILLTPTTLCDLQSAGKVLPGSISSVGFVNTGIAVPAHAAMPAIGTRNDVADMLSNAEGIYVPDLQKSTAGAHVASVLKSLGLHRENVCEFPSGGHAAMSALAKTEGQATVGCTQVTEILSTSGVKLVGALPGDLALRTEYVAAVSADSSNPEMASQFIEWLCGNSTLAARRDAGFEE